MAAATAIHAVYGDAAAVVTASGASHGLAALAQKLQHPLVRIRARALANLLFKLRERLVDIGAEPPLAIDTLMRALVASLQEKELEASALQVLQLLLLDTSIGEAATRACATALRRHGAAAAFQRGGLPRDNTTANMQATYEALLHRLLATSSAIHEEQKLHSSRAPSANEPNADPRPRAPSPALPPHESSHTSSAVRAAAATVSAVAATRSTTKKDSSGDALTHNGWHFPHVTLAAVDEQLLFESEVKWRLRTSVPEVVEMCDTFRRELLRDFPAEIFLQRPSMLLRVLELVCQPIVPAATTPELSFGVNYFDEPASRGSFVWKPSVLATALHVSTLKALESWLAALRHSMEITLNPMYHTFQSSSSSGNLGITMPGYDHRRLHYPRVSEEDDRVDGDEAGMSLSGAAYLIIATLMRLLSSEIYPHLHLLNLMHIATAFLPDKSVAHRGNAANALDKARLEELFVILVEVVRLRENDLDALVRGSIVEWLVVVVQQLGPTAFRVEGKSIDHALESDAKIVIPFVLWKWLLHQLAINQAGNEEGAPSMIQLLGEIDASASTIMRQFVRSSEYSTQVAAALDDNSQPGTLSLATQVLRVVPGLSDHQRPRAVRIVLDAVCRELDERALERVDQTSDDIVSGVLTETISLVYQEIPAHCRDFAASIFDGLIDWMLEESSSSTPNRRVKTMLSSVSASDDFLHLLLCAVVGSELTNPTADVLWRLAELLLRALDQDLESPSARSTNKVLSKSVPIMQHLAYFDSSASTTNDAHRRMQRTLMHLVHEIEATLAAPDQLLFVSRCLIHRSAVVRRAAASGLHDRLRQAGVQGLYQMSPGSPISADPFGQFADGKGENERRELEVEIPSILQHRVNNGDHNGSGSTKPVSGSSILHRISSLRKLLSSLLATEENQSSTQSAVASTVQQLVIDLVHANAIDFTILEESGDVEELMHLSIRMLSRHEEAASTCVQSIRASSLSIVRVVLTRSAERRQLIREDVHSLHVLLPFVFDEEPRVRAEMYFIVVALTCCLEVVTLKRTPLGLVVPSEFSTTFGLFSERWSVSGVTIQNVVDAFKSQSPHRVDELVLTPDGSLSSNTTLNESLQRVWDGVVAAKSFRTFLDALYTVLHACHGRRNVCTKLSARWEEAPFRRYLETPPTSAKDQVVMAAILALLNVLFDSMSTDQQMDVIFLLRNKIIPLHLARERISLKTTALPAQLARLLLRTSRSSMANMFVPLLVDTGLANHLGSLIVSSGVTGGPAISQQSLWMQVTLAALGKSGTDNSPGRHQLLEAVRMPLQTISGRHRVPGSFQERDLHANAVSCLVAFQDVESDTPWRTRLLFDSMSNLRSMGFQAAALTLGIDDRDAVTRILRLASDTMRDDTESDAVRSSATDLLFEFYRRVERDALPSFTSCVDGERFVLDLIRDLVQSTRARVKCTVRQTLSRIQLLRLFVCNPVRFANTAYGNALDHFVSDANEDSRTLLVIVELLSLRRAFELYQHHTAKFLRLQPGEDNLWLRSILPVVLSTVSEVAQLLQVVAQQASSPKSRPVEVAPFMLQLVETVSDISKWVGNSLRDGVEPAKQYYDALDQCGKLLALVLSSAATAPLPSDTANHLLCEIAALLNPAHPRLFRLSFARVIPAMLCRPVGISPTNPAVTTHLVSIGESLWAAYGELCELQPMGPNTTHRRMDSFLPHLRRVAFALHVLLSHSQDVSSHLCDDRHGAVQHVVHAIKKSFAAVRILGGFGTKSTKSTDDGFLLEICEAVRLHCHVLSGLFVLSSHRKTLACDEPIPTVFAANWNIMRVASRRGSGVLVSALRLLQNFIASSEANKTSLATTTIRSSSNGGSDGERNLLVMISELAIGGSASLLSDERWSSVASSILKSALLQLECLHSAIKTGIVARILSTVVDRSRRRRETSKAPSPHEEQTLIELVGVLASIASSDEGRHVVLQVRELRGLLDDIFHFPDASRLMVAGALFVRNMAFPKFSKSHFAVWEPALGQILALLYRWGSDGNYSAHMVAADHLSTALLCFVHDNQRAQSGLQSSRKQMLLLSDATRAWGHMASVEDQPRIATVRVNLERVTSLVTSDEGNDDP